MELDFLCGVGKVGLEQGIRQQPSYPLEDKLEVLKVKAEVLPVQLPLRLHPSFSSFSHNLVNLQSPEDLGLDITASIKVQPLAPSPAGQKIPYARLQFLATPRWTPDLGSLTI